MGDERVSARHAIYMNTLFLLGSSAVMGVNSSARQDSWIALLLTALIAFPFFMIYARILQLHPEKSFFEKLDLLMGPILGKVMTLLMSWFALHLCALVLRNFSEFIVVTLMPETPQLPVVLAMVLVVSYLAKSGPETFGRWASFVFPFVTLISLLTSFFSLNEMKFDRILPILQDPAKVLSGTQSLLTFPFLELVIFLCAAGGLRKGENPYKTYRYSLLLGTSIMLIILLRNIFTMGPYIMSDEYFPSFFSARVINLGSLLTRVEGSIAMNFILAGIAKITMCLWAATKGGAHLFGISSYQRLLMPMALLAAVLSTAVYTNITASFDFLEIYQYYALPFEIGIPVVLWILLEIRVRRQRSAAQTISAEEA